MDVRTNEIAYIIGYFRDRKKVPDPFSSYGWASKEFLLEEIKQFYPKEEQEKYGVIGIRMELLNLESVI